MLKHPILLFQDVNLEPTEEVSQSLFDVLKSSGTMGLIIVFVLLVLAVAAVYIFIERYSTINRASNIDENFMNQIRAYMQSGNIEAAKSLCQSVDSPAARMIEKGIMRASKPLEDIRTSIETEGNLELYKLEKNLSTLASIAGAAPMIGFFGTVTGMISAFYKMSTENNITPDVLAGGIYQALLTTAFGLFIGILAFVGYNLLVAKIDKVLFKMEANTVSFIDLMYEPS